jgi:hypothetical protein
MKNEIDLHGLLAAKAIEEFIKYYNERVRRTDLSQISVIHGYGSSGTGGKILVKLRNFLARNSDKLSFIAGEESIYRNPGITLVKPRKLLPGIIDMLASEILDYCEQPKTRNRIAGKFCNAGETRIKEAITELEKKDLLTFFNKGQYRVYQSKA